ncbi:RBBP9/YdeN family alpha/beta hydrolase [Ereboglobus luteus]|uniref:Esterase n=1 Tax=Ereboglobus luteus TaxID=1796921 RepID=A0A2U8E0L2_9BACT|nr:alpha/beta hydrolase [Ereboglobus luteus]AWI08393.1 hypothetical protein CKA38_03220 [Ereboglobus luteus]
MKNNAFVIHGSFGSPFENWFPSLHKRLCANDWTAIVPHFPSPQGQTFLSWCAILDSYRQARILTDKSVFICHSSASPFVLKYAVRKQLNFRGLVTVSGFNNFYSGDEEFDKINSEFYQETQELLLASRHFDKKYSYFSNDDPYLPFGVLESFSKAIGSTKFIRTNAGHFNTRSGYDSFDEIAELLINSF